MTTPTKRGNRKKLFIVEDHPVFRDGLAALFNHDPGLHVCGTATDGAEALKKLRRLRPDALIVDIGLPGKNGIELIREVLALDPGIAILVVSMCEETMHARRALRAGARGYLMKHEGPERLLEAVHQVLAGKTCVSPRVTGQILKSFRSRGIVEAEDLLSAREREVLRLIGDGRSTAEIARSLAISTKTVDSYRTHIKDKLGFADAHELLYYAVRRSASENSAKGNQGASSAGGVFMKP